MNEETYGTCTEERSVRAPSSPSRALFWLGCLVAVAVCVRAADGSLRRTERTQSVSETVRSKRMQRCNLNEGEVWLIRHGEKADKLTPGTPEYWGLNASGFARAEYVAGLITSGVWPQFSRVYACHPGRSLRPLETAIPIGIALGQRVDDRFRPREYLHPPQQGSGMHAGSQRGHPRRCRRRDQAGAGRVGALLHPSTSGRSRMH
eukprot:TRINITY_DN11962_c0_g1_i3.p1 TRINITY_DN11962_c0_g1~~TRINITY_DN11962_c0_g1_i3.p1  ORF type:complete len:222 (+),score=1.92 TRINITY_DN11962_c0_g1_i3:52-666(+)